MHRSGTSFFMSLLVGAGLEIGQNIMRGGRWNAKGFFESKTCVAINKQVLRQSGGSWRDPPARLRVTASARWRIRGFLSSFDPAVVHGFKDPRLCLTFDAWKPLLNDPLVIVCFRHPAAVARSLNERDRMTLSEGFELWRAYGEAILRQASSSRLYLLNFDRVEESEPILAACCRDAGLVWSPELLAETYDGSLQHHRTRDDAVPESCRSVYANLHSRWEHGLEISGRPSHPVRIAGVDPAR
jgi:hypothetical protein